MLYPTVVYSPDLASQQPNLILQGNLAVIPIDMTVTLMIQIIVAQVTMTEDFSLRAWVSQFPNGQSLLTSPLFPDYFALSKMTPRPLVIYVAGQIPPPDCILAVVTPGQYFLNILNMANAASMFGYMNTILA